MPLLTYGWKVWGHTALRTLRLRRRLLKTERMIVIMVNKAYQTISYNAIIIAGVKPIDLLIKGHLNMCE